MVNEVLSPPAPADHPWVVKRADGRRLDLRRKAHAMFGLVFDSIDMQGTVDHVRACAKQRERCFLSTVNLNFTVTAQHHEAVRHSLIASDLVVVDGMPLVWAAKAMRIPIRERVAGSDLIEQLQRPPPVKQASQGAAPTPALRLFFFGGEDGVAAQAVAALNAKQNALHGCGYASPGFASVEAMSSDAQIHAINQTRPDFVAVSIGAAKGQAWILANQSKLDAPVVSYLGAVVNFVAGHVERAPVLMRRLGLEWLWRIVAEPALWRRYFDDGRRFAQLIWRQVLPSRRAALARLGQVAASTPGRIELSQGETSAASPRTLMLQGDWPAEALDALREQTAAALARGESVRWDLKGATFIDSALVGLALLVNEFQAPEPVFSAVERWPQAIRDAVIHAGAERLLEDS